jgi:histidinol-phosphatase
VRYTPQVADQIADRALQVALRAADASRAAILRRWQAGFSVETKADSSPVTEADREAEQAIREVILGAFPDHKITGEELGSAGEGELGWLVDPIDGTISFVHRVPLFATLIALCRGGQAIVAVVDLPGIGRRFHATAGGGAWEGNTRLRVPAEWDPAHSLACRGNKLQFERSGRMALYAQLDAQLALLRSYTDAFGHAMVASGSAGLMVDPDLNPWDLAAPALLIREAGGRVLELPESDGKTCVIAGSPAAVAWVERLL